MGLEYRCDSCGCLVDKAYLRMSIEEPLTEGYDEFDIYFCEDCKKTFTPMLETFCAYKSKKFVLVKA